MRREMLEQKYIDLLLKRCINFDKSKSLFIIYPKENKSFVDKLVIEAKKMGVEDIYLSKEDAYKKHEVLKSISIDEIDSNPMFNNSIRDEYALKDASFLILETETPGLMDDVDPQKVSRARYVERITSPTYKKRQLSFQIPWCIAALPSREWANKMFPNRKDSYDKLFDVICDACMVNTVDPIKSWNQYLLEEKKSVDKLNKLKISGLTYKNSLGTDLHIELTPNTFWSSAATMADNILVNMPSYEIFTNPHYGRTEGIVYSSKPLFYNGGLIDDFFLEFKKGKVVNYGAKTGLELLKGIIESDEYSAYLGEAALVEIDSPIAKTGLIFSNTLFDENASCHLALGNGFAECVKDSNSMSELELIQYGVNPSKNHVDFMIGTPDLTIIADTNKGQIIIFKDGKLNI